MKYFLDQIESTEQTGWLFGAFGSTTYKTKCCLTRNYKDLISQLEKIHLNLSLTDRYLIVDTSILPESLSWEERSNFSKLLNKIAIDNNLSVIAMSEKIEETFEPIDGIKSRRQYRTILNK
jgi:hypothetical protein